MKGNSRKHYRVTPDEAQSLEVLVATMDGGTFPGELLDITIEGAGTRFRRDAGPTLAVGQTAVLTFTSVRLRQPIKVRAKVRSRVEMGAFRSYRYGFEFGQWDDQERRLSWEIRRLFNQRGGYRAEPRPTAPIAAVLRIAQDEQFPQSGGTGGIRGKFETAGVIKDLSTTGIAIAVDREAETTLATADLVEITFQLPNSATKLRLTGWIRHRELDEDRVCYGIEYDLNRSKQFKRQHGAITSYIRRRQLEEPPK
ncbi:MAG: PilZ domain-containing protein [Acidiferrobacterales bacterium]